MMTKKILALTAVAVSFFLMPAFAEFYQYTDDNGVVHYTDDYSTIPEAYQSQVAEHPETPVEFSGEDRDIRPGPGQTALDQDQKNAGVQAEESPEAIETSVEGAEAGSQPTDQLIKQRQALIGQKEQLQQEHEKLLQEKQTLESTREELNSTPEVNAFNQKVEALNLKIIQYHEKIDNLKSKIEEYNHLIEKQQSAIQ